MEELIAHINEYTVLYLIKKENVKRIRLWVQTSVQELYAYFVVIIYIGIYIESDIKDYWNRNLKEGPLYTEVFNYISLVQW